MGKAIFRTGRLQQGPPNPIGVGTMLYWVFVLLILSIVAGLLGFGGIAIAFAEVARLLFFVFLVLFLFSLLGMLVADRSGPRGPPAPLP